MILISIMKEVTFRTRVQVIGRISIPAKLRKENDWLKYGSTVAVVVRPVKEEGSA